MKWTADNDQLLFIKLIETHDVSIKAEKIRAAWPTDREIPTARAISERILRIRNNHKASTTGSTPSTPRKRKGPETDKGTPKTPRLRKTAKNDEGSESPAKHVKNSVTKASRTREVSDDASDSDIYV